MAIAEMRGKRGIAGGTWQKEVVRDPNSLEKALSRRPGLLGTGAEETTGMAAGVLSGSTSLEGRDEEVRKGTNFPLPPPTPHSQVALIGVVILIFIFGRILTGWLYEE